MEYVIRKATTDEYTTVRDFYYTMIEWLDTAEYGPGWKKDIYPSPQDLISALENGELWVCELDGKFIASMIINSSSVEGYNDVNWIVKTDPSRVSCLHALGVLPEYHGSGLSTKMVVKAIEIAKSKGHIALRLDVLSGNLPAERLYPKLGFKYIGEQQIYYEDTGLTDYKLFEYLIIDKLNF